MKSQVRYTGACSIMYGTLPSGIRGKENQETRYYICMRHKSEDIRESRNLIE